MALDREDPIPQPGSLPARPLEAALDSQPPTLWLGTRAPRVAVVVKKRRLAGPTGPDDTTADATAAACDAAQGERRPRVFVLPREATQPAAADATAATTTAAADGMPSVAPAQRGRRLRAPWRRPSPVVHIVRAPEPAPPTDVDTMAGDAPETGADGAPALPALPTSDGYREVQAALAQLRRRVDEARRASAFVVAPGRRRS